MNKKFQFWMMVSAVIWIAVFSLPRITDQPLPSDNPPGFLGSTAMADIEIAAPFGTKILTTRSGSNFYARIVRVSDLGIWDTAAEALAAAPTWANTDIALADATATAGGYTLTIPSALDEWGWYYAFFYDSASPASSNTLQFPVLFLWQRGTIQRIILEL